MKYYAHNEPTDADCSENRVVVFSEKEIIDFYFSYWSDRIKKLFSTLSDSHIRELYLSGFELSHEKCIEAWVVIHWAWETGPNGFLLF